MQLATLGLRFLLCFLVIAAALGSLSPSGAWADTVKTEVIYDLTDVYPWKGTGRHTGSPSDHWTDIIANDPADWDIKRVEVSWLFTTPSDPSETISMKIFTNYPLTGGEGGTADIWLKNRDTGTMAGILLHDGSDKLVTGITWASSRSTTVPNQWSNGNWIYGGEYAPRGANPNPGALPLSYIQSFSDTVGTVSVSQVNNPNPTDSTDSTYITTLVFPLYFLDSEWLNFDFTVMSGTCGNEVVAGNAASERPSNVPLPPSAFLLGSGLLGLGLIGFRRQRS